MLARPRGADGTLHSLDVRVKAAQDSVDATRQRAFGRINQVNVNRTSNNAPYPLVGLDRGQMGRNGVRRQSIHDGGVEAAFRFLQENPSVGVEDTKPVSVRGLNGVIEVLSEGFRLRQGGRPRSVDT